MNWHRLLTWIAIIAAWVIFACLCVDCSSKPLKNDIEQLRVHNQMKTYMAIEIKTWKASVPWIIRGRELKRKWWREYGN